MIWLFLIILRRTFATHKRHTLRQQDSSFIAVFHVEDGNKTSCSDLMTVCGYI